MAGLHIVDFIEQDERSHTLRFQTFLPQQSFNGQGMGLPFLSVRGFCCLGKAELHPLKTAQPENSIKTRVKRVSRATRLFIK